MYMMQHLKRHYIRYSILILILALWLWALVAFNTGCVSRFSSFKPIPGNEYATDMQQYQRTEESTYLTFSEWSLVYLPQSYAAFISDSAPSKFPYFGSIREFWSGYCSVYGLTKPHYPFNSDNHLMLSVIGVSSSLEYIVKGVYENTIGMVSEWTAFGEQVPEDVYAAKIAYEYGQFIPRDPWYAFPFGKAFVGVWTETGWWGDNLIRKYERKLFLSFEYGAKYLYSLVIKAGTRLVYGLPDDKVFVLATNVDKNIFNDARVQFVSDVSAGTIISVPHYQGFTDVIPELAMKGVNFVSVANNNEIAMSLILPVTMNLNVEGANVLFGTPLIEDVSKQRVLLQVEIKKLAEVIRKLHAQGISVEHLYDY